MLCTSGRRSPEESTMESSWLRLNSPMPHKITSLQYVLRYETEPWHKYDVPKFHSLFGLLLALHWRYFLPTRHSDGLLCFGWIQDANALMKLLTFKNVEEMVKRRVEKKAAVFGQRVSLDDTEPDQKPKIDQAIVSRLYDEWVMPLTKLVQVEYLLRRLDWDQTSSDSFFYQRRTEATTLIFVLIIILTINKNALVRSNLT